MLGAWVELLRGWKHPLPVGGEAGSAQDTAGLAGMGWEVPW